MSGAPRLGISLHASRTLAGLLVAAHAAAAAAAWAALGGGTAAWACAGLFLVLGASAARRHALLAAGRSPVALQTGPDGWCRVATRDGRAWEGGTRFRRVTPWWVIVPPVAAGAPAVFVARGMADAEAFRRLRVWGLWGGAPGTGEPLSA